MPRSAIESQPRDSVRRRRLLLDTALQLFAERGIDGVSLREIGIAARQGNTAAVHYFFGDKEGLLLAVMQHLDELAPDRWAVADELLASTPPPSLEDLASAMVRPFVALYQADPHAASFMAKAMVNPRRDVLTAQARGSGSFLRVFRELTRRLEHLPRRVAQQRVELAVMLVIHAVADHADSGGALLTTWKDAPQIVDELTDAVIGLLTAPVTSRAAGQSG